MAIAFPGESAEYRLARDRLLAQEIELRRAMEAVAAMRRELPPSGGGVATAMDDVCGAGEEGGVGDAVIGDAVIGDTGVRAVFSVSRIFCTSSLSTVPRRPLPAMFDGSMPSSFANRAAAGDSGPMGVVS